MNVPFSADASCGSEHCITCGDDGVPMTVVAVNERSGLALCAARDGTRSSVETALLERVHAGDRVLVHAGVAIASLPGEPDQSAAYTSAFPSPAEALAAQLVEVVA